MERCTKCGSSERIKNGFVNGGHRRYRCKSCGKNYTITTRKYDLSIKLKVILMYLEGLGIRSIERIEGISNPLIISWIKKIGKILQEKIVTSVSSKATMRDIEILEIDELVTYCKKNPKKFGSGLPLLAIGTKLLIFK